MQRTSDKTVKLIRLDVLAELASVDAFVNILSECRDKRDLAFATEVHTHVCHVGLDLHWDVGNHVVPMFVDCGSLPVALQVFMKLQHRNIYSWTTLMQGLAQYGKWQMVLQLYECMKVERVNPCSYTIIPLLKACAGLKDTETAQGIHSEMVQIGHDCVYMGTALVDLYAKCGLLNEARNVFHKLLVRNVVTWNCLLAGYADYGTSVEALQCLEQMRVDGIHPDIITFVSILKVCANTGTIKAGQEIHIDLTKQGNEPNTYAGNVLVDMYARHGFVVEAQNVFDRLPGRDSVSWTTLVAGYVEQGKRQEALNSVEQLQFEEVFLDAAMFACVLKMCGSIGAIEKGLEFHMNLHKKGIESNVYVGSTLVDMYAKCGRLVEAHQVLDKLPQQNVVAWNAMIHGCGINEESDYAVKVFEDMRKKGVKPDATTFLCLLTACSRASLVRMGREYFQMMRENYKVSPNLGHLMCVADLLARSGKLWEAGKFLKSVPSYPSRNMWTSLLSACKTYAEEKSGGQCFNQLIQTGSILTGPVVIMDTILSSMGILNNAYRVESRGNN